MDWLGDWAVGAAVTGLAFGARVLVHAGRTPGGVDTWYYLAYARAVRALPSLKVLLPQYLLQDPEQSYPPLFPSALAMLPERWLDQRYWVISPLIDCLHLLLLYIVTYRLTGSVGVGAMAAATYALTPHLVSETRSLSARPFGALLHTVAVLLMLKWVLSSQLSWAVAALGVGALLFLSSAAMAAAYGFVGIALSLAFADPRPGLCACGALALAFCLSGGRMGRVVRNYSSAVRYWRRNRRLYGAHPVRNSPLYGEATALPLAQPSGVLGPSTIAQCLRLLAENPFLIALPLARHRSGPWEYGLYAWAAALAALSVIATVVPPLRAFGPGRSYVKAAIFPTAYSLAYEIGTPAGLLRPFGLLVLLCLGLSVGAIVFFCVYLRRKPTEQSASTPAGLVEVTRALGKLPVGRGLRAALHVCGLRLLLVGPAGGVGRSLRRPGPVRMDRARHLASSSRNVQGAWRALPAPGRSLRTTRGRASSRARSADRQLRWLRGARVRGIRGRGPGAPDSVSRTELVPGILIAGLATLVVSLTVFVPRVVVDAGLDSRTSVHPLHLVAALLLFVGFTCWSRLGTALVLATTIGLSALVLAGIWGTGASSGAYIGGLVPFSDARAYLHCGRLVAEGGTFEHLMICSRRPLFTALLAGLLRMTGENLRVVNALLMIVTNASCRRRVFVAEASIRAPGGYRVSAGSLPLLSTVHRHVAD